MAYVAQSQSFSANVFARAAAVFAAIADQIERRRVYKTTLNELSVLSNRELADLGIGRSEIQGIALEAAGLK